MKTFELEKYDVQEMNTAEMATVEGGSFLLFIGVVIGFLWGLLNED
jgi:hypothetical protein